MGEERLVRVGGHSGESFMLPIGDPRSDKSVAGDVV